MRNIKIISLIFVLCLTLISGLFLGVNKAYADDPAPLPDPLIYSSKEESFINDTGERRFAISGVLLENAQWYQLKICEQLDELAWSGDIQDPVTPEYSFLEYEVTLLDEYGEEIPYTPITIGYWSFDESIQDYDIIEYEAREITGYKTGLDTFIYIPQLGVFCFEKQYALRLSFDYRVEISLEFEDPSKLDYIELNNNVSITNGVVSYTTESSFDCRLWKKIINNRHLEIYQGDVKDISFYEANFLASLYEGQPIALADIEVDVNYFDPASAGTVLYKYYLDGDLITEVVTVTIIRDDYFKLELFFCDYLGNVISNSSLAPYNFGNVTYNEGLNFYVLSNVPELYIGINDDSGKLSVDYEMEGQVGAYYVYAVVLTPNYFIKDQYNFEILTNMYGYDSDPLYFSVRYVSSVAPTITLNTIPLRFDRSATLGQIETAIRNHILSITDLDDFNYAIYDARQAVSIIGTIIAGTVGDYTVSIEFESEITGNIGSETITIEIYNSAPVVNEIVMQYDSNIITNGANIEGGTVLTGSIIASDPDSDNIVLYNIYIISGADVVEITSFNSHTGTFTITPYARKIGIVLLGVEVTDALGIVSAERQFIFTYVDTAKPQITFTNDIVANAVTLNKGKNEVDLQSFIDDVYDEFNPSLSINNVLITSSGITIRSGRYATFTVSKDYVIIFTLPDGNGNTEVVSITITVKNKTPTADSKTYYYNEDGGILSYKGVDHKIQLIGNDDDLDDEISFFIRTTPALVFVNELGMPYNFNPIRYDLDPSTGIMFINSNPLNEENNNTPKYFVGTVSFDFYIMDSDLKASNFATITFVFVDNIAPRLTENTAMSKSFMKGISTGYAREGYFTAWDEIEGDITITPAMVTVSFKGNTIADVNFNELGTYTLTYSVVDSQNNPVINTVIIEVTKGSSPIIVMRSKTATIAPASSFNIYDFILRVDDVEDGVKTSAEWYNNYITVVRPDNWPTNLDVNGTYIIKLQAHDTDGNMSKVIEFTLIIETPTEDNTVMIIIIAGGGVVLVVAAIIISSILIRKRKMRI